MPSIAGTYVVDVDHHEKPCGTEVDPTDVSDPFFIPLTGWTFDIVEYPDKPYPFSYRCWVHTTEPCHALTVTAFEKPRWNGWYEILPRADASDGTCTLTYGVLSLTQDGDRMLLDTTWYKQITAELGACTEAEARARATSMPCYKYEHVEATLR
jgi:hypothetical protein